MPNYEITYVDPRVLKYRPDNRNLHPPEQVEKLKQLIAYNGFRVPVIVSKRSGLVVAGHCRIQAAKELGLNVIPIIYQDFSSDEDEYSFHVSENAISQWSDLDLSGINADLEKIGPFDIDLLALKDFTVDMAEKETAGPGEKKEVTCPNCSEKFIPNGRKD